MNLSEHWDNWGKLEGQELEYKYFLGNQRVVSSTQKPFLLTRGTQLKIGTIILGESIEITVGKYNYIITNLIQNIQEKEVKYKSGDRNKIYRRSGGIYRNFLSDWFTKIQ